MIRIRSIVVMAFVLAAPAAYASAVYRLTGIGFLDPIYGVASFALAINSTGTVTGYADVYDSSGAFQGLRAFTYQSGQLTNLGVPTGALSSTGYSESQGLAINASGQVAGVFSYYEDPSGSRTGDGAFLSNSGLSTVGGRSDVNDPTLIPTRVFGINDSGVVTGSNNDHAFYQALNGTPVELPSLRDNPDDPWFSIGNGINSSGAITGQADVDLSCGCIGDFAFIYVNGIMTNLGSVGNSDFSEGFAINDTLQVAGDYIDDNGDFQAALFDQGSIVTLGWLPGAFDSSAAALNNNGQIVGDSGGSAFLYSAGMLQDLNDLIDPTLGWHLLAATGINDAGQIVGVGIDPDGFIQGFILDTPEPGTFVLLGAGTLGLLFSRRQRVVTPG